MDITIDDRECALPWSEAFIVGHAGLDADHRHLVRAINEVCAAARANRRPRQLRSLLGALKLATESHLEREDAILREISDGVKRAQPERRVKRAYLKAMSDTALEEHLAEHREALAKLASITRACHSQGGGAGSSLCVDLKDWFLEHAVKYDAHLKAIFQSM